MNAYLFKYTHVGEDKVFCRWKIAKDEKTAFKFAFGVSQKKNQKVICTKRGLRIELRETETHEVSEILPISPVSEKEPTREVSNTGDDCFI